MLANSYLNEETVQNSFIPNNQFLFGFPHILNILIFF